MSETQAAVGSAPGAAMMTTSRTASTIMMSRATAGLPLMRAQVGTASILKSFEDLQKNWDQLSTAERIVGAFDLGRTFMNRLGPSGGRSPEGRLSGMFSSFAMGYLMNVNMSAQADLKHSIDLFSGVATPPAASGINAQLGSAMLRPDDNWAELLARAEQEAISEKSMLGLLSVKAMEIAAEERAERARAAAARAAAARAAEARRTEARAAAQAQAAAQANAARQAAANSQRLQRQESYDSSDSYDGADFLLDLATGLAGAYAAGQGSSQRLDASRSDHAGPSQGSGCEFVMESTGCSPWLR